MLIDSIFTLFNNSCRHILHPPFKPIHFMWRLILINKVFRKISLKRCLIRKLNIRDISKLHLSMLTKMCSQRIAWILFVVENVLLMIGDDHIFMFIIY